MARLSQSDVCLTGSCRDSILSGLSSRSRTITTEDSLGEAVDPSWVGKIAPVALVAFYIALEPLAIWHGLLDTSDASTTYSTVADQRAGWYFLHYGISVCLLGISVSLIAMLARFTLPRSPSWTLSAMVLMMVGAASMTIGFGAEAIGFYYATDVSLIEQPLAIDYVQAWLDGGYYLVPVAVGLAAFTLGQAAAVRSLYHVSVFPVLLRRLLIVAIVLDIGKFVAPIAVAIPLGIAATAIWIALGLVAFRMNSAPAVQSGIA